MWIPTRTPGGCRASRPCRRGPPPACSGVCGATRPSSRARARRLPRPLRRAQPEPRAAPDHHRRRRRPPRRNGGGGDAARFRFFRATIDEESDLISRHELSTIPYDLRRGSAQKHGQSRGESSFSSFPGFAVWYSSSLPFRRAKLWVFDVQMASPAPRGVAATICGKALHLLVLCVVGRPRRLKSGSRPPALLIRSFHRGTSIIQA